MTPEMKNEYDRGGVFHHYYKQFPTGTQLIQTRCSNTIEAIHDQHDLVGHCGKYQGLNAEEWCETLCELDKLCWYRGGQPELPGFGEGPNFPCYLPKNMFQHSNMVQFEFNGFIIELTQVLRNPEPRPGEFMGQLQMGSKIYEKKENSENIKSKSCCVIC